MSAIVTRSVNDLAEPDRKSLENLLGCPLGAEQQVFVMAFELNTRSNENSSNAAIHRIRDRLAGIDRYQAAKGIAGDEIEAAIDGKRACL